MVDRANLAGFRDYAPEADDFAADVLEGLSARPKTLPCKYLYDRRGSRLFEDICELEEYYPTRTEMKILADNAREIAMLFGPRCHVVEFGSGASTKIRLILAALRSPAAYTAVDISRDMLLEASVALARDFPRLPVIAVCADYTKPFEVPAPPGGAEAKRVGFFPGSTIGNFTPEEAAEFLEGAARLLKPGGGLLIGVDLKKDRTTLERAYDDSKGVSAAFNLNLLYRINRELGGTFDLSQFTHRAFYNDTLGRMEMHLMSRTPQIVRVRGQVFRFATGETIHTENSYKYAIEEFQALASGNGFAPERVWTDANNLFSVHYLRVI